MKYLTTVFLVFLGSSSLNAQVIEASSGSPAEIVKFSWSKERRNWEQNPFGGPNENFHEMQFRARSEKRVSDAKQSNSAQLGKLENDARVDAAIIRAEREKKGPPRYVFLYRMVVKNSAPQAIKEIDWDYVFRDAGTGEELGRQPFTSVQKVEPGKTKELSFILGRPPTHRISVYALDKKERQGLVEEVVISRIHYADGSTWRLPSN